MKAAKGTKNTGVNGAEQMLDATRAAVEQVVELTDASMKAGYEGAEAFAQAQVEQMAEVQHRSSELAAEQLKVLDEVGQVMVSNATSAWKEMTSFAQASTRGNLDTLRSLSAAKDPAEWMGIQTEALTGVASRFAQYAANMSQLAQNSAANIYGPVSRQVERNVENVKASAAK